MAATAPANAGGSAADAGDAVAEDQQALTPRGSGARAVRVLANQKKAVAAAAGGTNTSASSAAADAKSGGSRAAAATARGDAAAAANTQSSAVRPIGPATRGSGTALSLEGEGDGVDEKKAALELGMSEWQVEQRKRTNQWREDEISAPWSSPPSS